MRVRLDEVLPYFQSAPKNILVSTTVRARQLYVGIPCRPQSRQQPALARAVTRTVECESEEVNKTPTQQPTNLKEKEEIEARPAER